ncbi:hypothetical protein CEQ21_24840 [Niallia circulans]|uniref:Uncharacterized protein n=1 Tax=Niallia circulans TaxID=1397 RepID=A0A553SNM8_NIACI|nr:hypothetical protein [Niallia circulans]TRZ38609.1 hypothetical protein CEQ21_24840 [Niallia circulans]
MAFAIYFFIGWFSIICFFVQKKKFSVVENTVLFLCVLIVNLNWTWLIYEELGFITYSHDTWDFVAYLIKRSIIIPLFVLISLNFGKSDASLLKKFMHIIVSTLVILGLTSISHMLKVTTVKDWSILYDLLYYIALHIFGLLIHKWYQTYIVEKENEVLVR